MAAIASGDMSELRGDMVASQQQNYEGVRPENTTAGQQFMLLSCRISSLSAVDEQGLNLLHKAAQAGRVEILEFLYEHARDLFDKNDARPALYAAAAGCERCLLRLHSYGMSFGSSTMPGQEFEGKRAAHLALEAGHGWCVRLLFSLGVEITDLHGCYRSNNSQTCRGKHPLNCMPYERSQLTMAHCVARTGDLNMLKVLREVGYTLNLAIQNDGQNEPDLKGVFETPALVALRNGQTKALRFLLTHTPVRATPALLVYVNMLIVLLAGRVVGLQLDIQPKWRAKTRAQTRTRCSTW